jgi:NADPH-dependent ferric siderophore reductase
VSLLSAQTSVALVNPEAIVDAFHEHFAEHMPMTREGASVRFETEYGNGTFTAEKGRFAAHVSCIDEIVLMSIKAMVAEHIVEFTGDTSIDFRWDGVGSELRELPNLFVGRVVRSYDLTPRMRRVVVAIEDGIERLMTGGMHVRILIPEHKQPRRVWPHLSKTGAIVWPEGDSSLIRRVYTIRSGDIARGEIDLDFVMHEGEDVPGATFGATAQAGDILGIIGPGGVMPEARDYVFAGDETALPVMLRMAAEMPADRKLTVYAEIDNEAERQEIVSKADVQWHWLFRNGQNAGTSGLINVALRDHDWANADADLHVFVGCEKLEARAAKKFLNDEIKLPRAVVRTAGYWSIEPPEHEH